MRPFSGTYRGTNDNTKESTCHRNNNLSNSVTCPPFCKVYDTNYCACEPQTRWEDKKSKEPADVTGNNESFPSRLGSTDE